MFWNPAIRGYVKTNYYGMMKHIGFHNLYSLYMALNCSIINSCSRAMNCNQQTNEGYGVRLPCNDKLCTILLRTER